MAPEIRSHFDSADGTTICLNEFFQMKPKMIANVLQDTLIGTKNDSL
jgi:hypothetical protein